MSSAHRPVPARADVNKILPDGGAFGAKRSRVYYRDLPMPALNETFEVFVKSVTHEAKGILAYELRSHSGEDLPPFTAGAHIDLHMEGAPVRSYSLLNSPSDRSRYVIAISLNEKGRGGSIYIHKNLHCGDTLTIAGPRNNFPLAENARRSILIAGGIGITPIWSMAQRLTEIDAHWELHYGVRSKDCAALWSLWKDTRSTGLSIPVTPRANTESSLT